MTANWRHVDAELSASIEGAKAAALNNSLDRSTMLPWLVLCSYTDAGLRGKLAYVASEGETELEITPGGPGAVNVPQERAAAAAILYRTVTMVAEEMGFEGLPPDRAEIMTAATREAGFLPLVAAIGVVLVRTATVAAVAWVAAKVVETGGVIWMRSQSAKELARTDMVARDLVDRHIDREVAAGKTVPLDAATKSALAALQARQAALAESMKAPPAPAVPGLDWLPWGLLAVGAVVVWNS